MRSCRLIVDAAADGAWNMAVDDALLTDAAERGLATLRFYGWSQPTLSLGYFQGFASRDEHAPSRDCVVVRRASGGGAILHHRELTYSLAMPAAFWPERDHGRLYCVVHDSLCEVLLALGVPGARRFGAGNCATDRRKDSSATDGNKSTPEPFLCFERRTEHDVVLNAAKVAGSAQRKRRGAVLQHGSVLLAGSEFAPSLPGIKELSGVGISPDQLIAAWQPLVAEALSLRLESATLPASTAAEAKTVVAEKFAASDWLQRR